MGSALQNYYQDILKNGVKTTPRGLATRGLFDQSFWFEPGEVFVRPRINLNIGFIELLQFISGTFSIKPFQVAAPNARLDLFTHQSAYGPRVVDQLPRVIEELRKDQFSRRAVMMIAHPMDTPETMPCTLSMQFQLIEREGAPLMFTIINMRSSDLMWGIPTDIIQFGGTALMVAQCVGAIAHECVINAGNAHIYEETMMSPSEEYRLGGHFYLPEYYNLDDYRAWANSCLTAIEEGAAPREFFGYNKIPVKRVESF